MSSLRVRPARGPLDVTVSVPGSKSIANRALVCAALAAGPSQLTNVPDGDDTVAMLDCLEALGITVAVNGSSVDVAGTGGSVAPGPVTLPCRLAGTTSRFITAVAALGAGPYVIDGEPPLRTRPMGQLHDALASLGVTVEPLDAPGHLPVRISREVAFSADSLTLRGDVSSQFLSALMLIAPYLPNGLHIELMSELVSEPYVALTAEVMASFGHPEVQIRPGAVDVQPGGYTGRTYAVEADASSATYAFAAAAAVGGRVRVDGLGSGSLQADARFADLLAQMGCRVDRTVDWTEVSREEPLRGVDADMRHFSDSAPTLATLVALASTPSRITGIGFIRAKESDRIGDVVRELQRCGADAEAEDDGFSVRPAPLHGALVHTYHDHRIAMAFGVMGLVVPAVEIDEPAVVTKSFPGFWHLLDQLSH